MAKKIVFLNLADMDEHGLAAKSITSMQKKYQRYSFIYELWAGANQIYRVDLFGLLKGEMTPKSGIAPVPINMVTGHMQAFPEIARERLAITMLCSSADKIMLGVHGRFDDTEQGFAGLGWGMGDGAVGNYKQFAKLLCSFLHPGKAYKLALIVCFGARSENFRKDHDGRLDRGDIESSFAFKFYKEVCATTSHVTMTARTGSVAFDENTGRSIVQTEAAVGAEIEDTELQKAGETERVAEAYERLVDEMTKTSEGKQQLRDMVNKMDNPVAVPSNAGERVLQEYNRIKSHVTELKSRAAEMHSKYGKFVYTCEAGKVCVYRKYEGGQKVMQLLYKEA